MTTKDDDKNVLPFEKAETRMGGLAEAIFSDMADLGNKHVDKNARRSEDVIRVKGEVIDAMIKSLLSMQIQDYSPDEECPYKFKDKLVHYYMGNIDMFMACITGECQEGPDGENH